MIGEAAAAQVRDLYKNYLSGLSLTNAAKEAGLDLLHAGAKRMMLNRHYLGDDFYPAIIDPASFDAVSAELTKRSTKLGRNDRYIAPIIKRPPTAFRLGDITENYELDCLKYIRQLKDKNIPVFFEKEAINTMDAKGEVLITIMASLAQQESQSLSQNVKLGLQFRYQNGQVQVNHNHFLGYTKDADENLIIDPEQAEVVKRIYREYREGIFYIHKPELS